MAEPHSIPTVLVLEDEKNLGSTLIERVRAEGFQVTWATTIRQALEEIQAKKFDIALLDVGLPDGSGFEVAELLRRIQPATAILFLTALGNAEDRIRGLELGAEDYVVKPFHLKELILRMKNGLKRARYLASDPGFDQATVQVGRAQICFQKFEAKLKDGVHPLTHKEVALLRLLVERRGLVVSRDEILNHAWSEDEFPTPRTVDNFIMRLRRLVENNPEAPEVIKSIRGIGYQLL